MTEACAPAGAVEGLLAELREGWGGGVLETQAPRARRAFIAVDAKDVRSLVQWMKEKWGGLHLSTITGRDTGAGFEVLYHFFVRGTVVTVRAAVPAASPEIPSITDLVPGAVFYEREVHDLLGIKPVGHPALLPLVLPEDWPAGQHPLRKDWAPAGGGER
ncbi:MAG: NADH-quinone oxidoreductase subunit C [Acetobacteraceae bacterium]|nr:NADH-quinone oxidoreductase subunit C [Acetobacteraceae bacterium]